MKIKLLLAIIVLVAAMALICAPTLLLPEGEAAEIYLKAGSGYEIVPAGSGYEIVPAGSGVNFADVLGIRLNIAGNTLSAQEVMRKLHVVRQRRSDIEGKACYYAYSPLLGAGVDVGGQIVNVQIVQGENCLIVGIPLIMGSY